MKMMPDSSASDDGLSVHFLGIDQVVGFLADQDRSGLGDGHHPRLGTLGHDFLEHALEVHLHLFEVARAEDRDGAYGVGRGW